MAGGRAWDVFLAYASPDRSRAWVLYEALVATGLKVCFDQVVLQPGDNWHRDLPRHLRASAIVVVLVSSHTGDAHFETAELLRAIEAVRRDGGRLVPVLLHAGAELPYGTEALHAIEFFEDGDAVTVATALAGVARHPERVAEQRVWCPRVPAVPAVLAGRDALLDQLSASTSGGAGTVLTQTIQGMGGVGKTTVAAALAESQRHWRDVVWWVRSEQPSVLVADLAELAPLIGVQIADDPADTAVAVRHWLESTDRTWLLVLDNAPDERSIEPWMPRRGQGASVVTSRNRNRSRIGRVVPVDTFPADVAQAFLRDRVGDRNPAAAAEDLTAMLERLNGLPLALEQAAAWVERTPNRRFAQYVGLFDDAAAEPFPDGTRPLGYEHTAFTAWRVSIDAASSDAPCASRLLAILSFLAPGDLPCEWLRTLATRNDDYLTATTAGVDEGLAALHDYSLVEIAAADTVSVHRVIQSAARRTAPPEAASAAVRLLRAQADGDASNHLRWPTLAALVPHALAVHATTGIAAPAMAGALWWVLDDLTTYHDRCGAVAAAIDAGVIALDIATSHFGADHPNTLTSRNNLAGAYRSAGDLVRAISLYEETLADRGRVLGPDHPDTLISRNDLAGAYRSAGHLARAIPIYESALADYERVLGPDHPHTLTSRNNLAGAYKSTGDLARAIPIYESTLADCERVLGPDHPHTLTGRSNLAGAYRSAGDLARAIPLCEATLADCERVLGPDHPDTLTSRNNLAHAYESAGDLARAVPLYVAILADRERVLGPDHPHTLSSRNNLALTYESGGDVARATPLYEATLADCERVLGPDHPDTLTSRNNLAHAYESAGDLTRAIPLFEATLADRERVLDPDHPDTLATRNNLADARRAEQESL